MFTTLSPPAVLPCISCYVHQYFFFLKHIINVDIHTRMSSYPYEHMHARPTPMSTSERLSWFDLEIHKVSHQERLAIDEDVSFH
jgi:hypothetical protein